MNSKKVFLVVFVLFIVSVSMLNAQSRGVIMGTLTTMITPGQSAVPIPDAVIDAYLFTDCKNPSYPIQVKAFVGSTRTDANGVYSFDLDPAIWPAAHFCAIRLEAPDYGASSHTSYTHEDMVINLGQYQLIAGQCCE